MEKKRDFMKGTELVIEGKTVDDDEAESFEQEEFNYEFERFKAVAMHPLRGWPLLSAWDYVKQHLEMPPADQVSEMIWKQLIKKIRSYEIKHKTKLVVAKPKEIKSSNK